MRLGGAQRLRALAGLLGGGIIPQTTGGDCQEALSSVTEEMQQPFATSIGNGLSSFVDVLVLRVFI